jgi:ribokinase
VLLCQLEIPLSAVSQAVAAAAAAGTVVILNAAPARPLPPQLLADVDVLVVNQGEAASIAGRDGTTAELLEVLLDLVPRVVMTLGPRGAAYADRSGLRLDVPAPKIDAVDTTAAGDAFTGALAVAWARRQPAQQHEITRALRWACAAGAVCAQRFGASTALPTADEIAARCEP